MASLIEEMYAQALGIDKLNEQDLRFAMGYLSSYDPKVFKAVMDATIAQERNMKDASLP